MRKTGGIIPTSVELRKIFVNGCGTDYDEMDRDFPFALMEEITSLHINFNRPIELGIPTDSWIKYRGFEKSKLEMIRTKIGPILSHKFSLRHYAMKKHKSIKSNFALWEQGKIQTTTSQGLDWQFLGDTAFTFWWFCIDGIPPMNNRDFIQNAEVFDEIKLDDQSLRKRGLYDVDFFASADLMSRAPWLPDIDREEVPILLRGKLQDLVETIFGYFLFTKKTATFRLEDIRDSEQETIAGMLLRMIDSEFPGFEVKIPGTVTNTEWQKEDPKKKKQGFFEWLFGGRK